LKDNGLGFILFVGFSFSRTEIFSTEIESDWISVEKPGGVLEVLEAAGGKLRVAQGPRSRRESGI
jgi:hypothetical protein